MTETVTSGSMSGAEKRGDGLLGESTTKAAARCRRRRACTPPRFASTLPRSLDRFAAPKASDLPRVPSGGCVLPAGSPRRSPPNGHEILDFFLVELFGRLFQ